MFCYVGLIAFHRIYFAFGVDVGEYTFVAMVFASVLVLENKHGYFCARLSRSIHPCIHSFIHSLGLAFAYSISSSSSIMM